jgi:hypothetical protein
MTKTILQLDHKDAKEFFLREESYTSVELPSYIKFLNAMHIDHLYW